MAIYSHPVLRNETDDIKGSATFGPPKIHEQKLIVDDINIDNEEIIERINNQKAAYLIYIENRAAFFSRTIKSYAPKIDIDINPNEYAEGEYTLEVLVAASGDINGYSLDSFHSDYKGSHFHLKSGDILAYLGSRSFQIDKNYGTLNEPKSIFEFETVEDVKIKGRSQVYLTHGTIKIQVHEDDVNEILYTLKGININYLILAYIIPALVYSLMELKKDSLNAQENDLVPEWEDANWAKSLFEIIDRHDLDLLDDNEVRIAHILAEDPIIESSHNLLKLATRRTANAS